MKNKALLLGNGINNIRQDYRWIDLTNNLINFIGATGQINLDNKPFPLLYEEIFMEAVKNRRFKEREIKDFIASEISKLKPNEIHQQVLDAKFEQIMTTNYDLTLESLLTNHPSQLRNNGSVKENTYNLFRHYKFDHTSIWHIHGDANLSGSITLGYEHYSGYLQQMRNYIVNGSGQTYKIKFNPLLKRLKNKSHFVDSWVDMFFTKDIFIVGLTLDFIEMHLWWLLTFRQRIILTNKLSIKNRIVYFYPDSIAKNIQNKLDLFKSIGVTPFSIPYQESNKSRYYQMALKKIKNNLK